MIANLADALIVITELEEQADKQFNIGFMSGYQSGMERAAVIASNVKAPSSRFTIAAKIRNEVEK